MANPRKNAKNSHSAAGPAIFGAVVYSSGNRERVHARQRVMMEVQEDDAQQHQHRTKQRVQEELDRGVKLARPAPDADQQIHRHQHGFPEHEEQEEVVGHEDAEHAGLQQQEPGVVLFGAVLNGFPRRQDRDRTQQRRQHDQQKRNAVDADHVARADRGDPVVGRAFHELEARALLHRPEPRHQGQRDRESQDAEDVRHPADRVFVLLRYQQQDRGPHQRGEQNDRKYVVIHEITLFASSAIRYAATANPY